VEGLRYWRENTNFLAKVRLFSVVITVKRTIVDSFLFDCLQADFVHGNDISVKFGSHFFLQTIPKNLGICMDS